MIRTNKLLFVSNPDLSKDEDKAYYMSNRTSHYSILFNKGQDGDIAKYLCKQIFPQLREDWDYSGIAYRYDITNTAKDRLDVKKVSDELFFDLYFGAIRSDYEIFADNLDANFKELASKNSDKSKKEGVIAEILKDYDSVSKKQLTLWTLAYYIDKFKLQVSQQDITVQLVSKLYEKRQDLSESDVIYGIFGVNETKTLHARAIKDGLNLILRNGNVELVKKEILGWNNIIYLHLMINRDEADDQLVSLISDVIKEMVYEKLKAKQIGLNSKGDYKLLLRIYSQYVGNEAINRYIDSYLEQDPFNVINLLDTFQVASHKGIVYQDRELQVLDLSMINNYVSYIKNSVNKFSKSQQTTIERFEAFYENIKEVAVDKLTS
jgi:hypothetical protein